MKEANSRHPQGPTPGITPLFPQCLPQTEECEISLQIGVFFDGTGNNQDWAQPDLGRTQLEACKDSNVARLFRAFPDKRELGFYRLYVPGVGTPFPEIGEASPSTLGDAVGRGGDGRINFALLRVLDFIHRSINQGRSRFSAGTLLALCRNNERTYDYEYNMYSPLAGSLDARALDAVGMQTVGGLLSRSNGKRPHAEAFYRRMTDELTQAIAAISKPRLVHIAIDVFGFSRGAAQARAFGNWLVGMMQDDKLCGVTTQLRFLGLFDTVASVGIPNSVGGDGHMDWAKPETMQIPREFHQCVHFIAMHENRASFPLESIRRPDGSLPDNGKQYAVPGMHSDVGGGYLPQEQGRGPSGQPSDVLSQIPLELMYGAATAAQVPVDRANARVSDYDPFDVHPDVRQANSNFMAASPAVASTAGWLLPYLAWRYQVRSVYADKLAWVARATAKDRQDLTGANQTLLLDIDALEGLTDDDVERYRKVSILSPGIYQSVVTQKAMRTAILAPEAQDVLAHVKAHAVLGTPQAPETQTPEAYLFANYMHDSYAGFRIKGFWEPQGYLRYRRVYRGTNDTHTNAPPTQEQLQEAQRRDEEAQRRALQNRVSEAMNKPLNFP